MVDATEEEKEVIEETEAEAQLTKAWVLKIMGQGKGRREGREGGGGKEEGEKGKEEEVLHGGCHRGGGRSH
jgi:hypothetical protein